LYEVWHVSAPNCSTGMPALAFDFLCSVFKEHCRARHTTPRSRRCTVTICRKQPAGPVPPSDPHPPCCGRLGAASKVTASFPACQAGRTRRALRHDDGDRRSREHCTGCGGYRRRIFRVTRPGAPAGGARTTSTASPSPATRAERGGRRRPRPSCLPGRESGQPANLVVICT
jgi:hypothetical protein